MTESIIVQIGQCGNQVGYRFWDLALKELSHHKKTDFFDDATNSFFRNVDSRTGADCSNSKDGNNRIKSLRARAVLIDMEEGVVGGILKGPLRELFDGRQLVTDVSGSGNNWATGHLGYGMRYREAILETVRSAAEACDCLQCFFLLHSMGGGTGSGLGTSVLGMLKDEYPDIYRFVVPVYPSSEDDVITSPYNSTLAMRCLTEWADCVLPVENQALSDLVNKATAAGGTSGKSSSDSKPFDDMNDIVANLLLNTTASARFDGSLNVDLNEIATNLVPYPRMHYLVASQTPVYCSSKSGGQRSTGAPPRKLDQMFTDAFSAGCQLLKVDPKRHLYLACGLMLRGDVAVSDIRRNIERLRPSLSFVHWNREGWKTGLCSRAPPGQPRSLLTLANNTCVRIPFSQLCDRFTKLYRRRAHVHHYTTPTIDGFDAMEMSEFDESLASLSSVVEEYGALEKQMGRPLPSPPDPTFIRRPSAPLF